MPQLITAEDLALVLDEPISDDRFDALYAQGLRIVRSGFTGDPETVTGRAADVVAGVLFGVISRIVANPKGARQLNAGSAAVTFGGADAEIASVFTLTAAERASLAEVNVVGSGGGAFTIRPGRR